jgi:predicted P-type ATPase
MIPRKDLLACIWVVTAWPYVVAEDAGSPNIGNSGASILGNIKANVLSFGVDSLGYGLTIGYLGILIALYGIYWLSRLIRCNNLKDNKVYVPELQLTQRGFVDSRFGLCLQLLTYLFVIWLHVAMFMAIIGHYQDQWPFDLSLAPGSVDWDSFTRVFISTWMGSIVFAFTTRFFRHRMDSFYLRPSSLSAAKYVKLTQVMHPSSDEELSVSHQEVLLVQTKPVRHVDFLLRKLVWSDAGGMFVAGHFFASHEPSKHELDELKQAGGLSTAVGSDRLSRFGRNEIKLSVPSFFSLIVEELSSTFFLYQIYAGCLLSLYWDYITAGVVCFVLIVTSASIKVYMERKERLLLRDMATLQGSVWVKRSDHWTRVTSEELVVGDLICISDDFCDVTKEIVVDCVLVAGSAVVDESSLTGETMPVQKHTTLSGKQRLISNDPDCMKSCLFAGTWLLQASDASDSERPASVSNAALAVVTATGGTTMRGDLIRSLTYGQGAPSILTMEFRVAMVFLILLANVNFWIVSLAYGKAMSTILPAVTSLVGLISPLLTVALMGGEIRSAGRLRKQDIHVKDVQRLTVAGKTDLVLLDKTGTITKSGIEFRGVVPSQSLRLTECTSKDSPVSLEMSACLALAHSVTRVNGLLVGHQVELQMIEAASKLGWRFSSDVRAPVDPGGNLWEVERLFPFSHDTMTMSAVVVQRSSGQRVVVSKGSFEAMRARCTDVNDEMSRANSLYAQDGYYVLSAGMRLLEDGERLTEKQSVETRLIFQGFFVFRNEVKSDSQSTVTELRKAGIDIGIVSGDSVFTAAAVGRQVGIVDTHSKVVIGVLDARSNQVEWRLADTDSRISEESLAGDANAVLCITGEVFDILKSSGKLELERTRIFGRVSPNQKAEIVNMYARMGRNVMMVGDGANDSIALKSAHSGLAIRSIAEANVAAPFSTPSESLSAIVSLLKEARCAMTTSLAAYRYLVAVGMVQTITKTMLYLQCGGYLSGVASLFLDCIQVPLMLLCICSALPAKNLSVKPPEGSLLGPEMVLGTTWSVLTAVGCIGIAEAILMSSEGYVAFVSSAPLSSWRERTDSFESALVVVLRLWLYMDLGLVYSYGSPHRRSLLVNWRLILVSACLAGLVGYLLFGPVGVPQAAFIVQVNKHTVMQTQDTVLNRFLFYYEKIGGSWNGMTDSIEFSENFRIALIAVLMVGSIIHHVGFRVGVIGPVTRWCRDRLGWKDGSCSCCRRRRHRGYKPLHIQLGKHDQLDESIIHAAEQESPAAEWELRRTYGRWRAPTEPEYK